MTKLIDDFEFIASHHKWLPGAKDVAWRSALDNFHRACKIYAAMRRSYS